MAAGATGRQRIGASPVLQCRAVSADKEADEGLLCKSADTARPPHRLPPVPEWGWRGPVWPARSSRPRKRCHRRPAGIIRYVNPAFTRMTGYSAEEAIGKNPRLLKSGKQNPEYYKDLWATIPPARIGTAS